MPFSRSGAVRCSAVVAALLLIVGVGACGKSGSGTTATTASGNSSSSAAGGPATTAPSAGGGTTIAIQQFKFNPDPSSFKVGDTVTVSNKDGTDHSFTADDGSFDSGVFSSGTKTITVSKAGTFKVHCKIHQFMTGSVVVK